MFYRPILHAAIVLLASIAAGHASAQINVTIQIGPPAPLYEPPPVVSPGSTWAPGYWAWDGHRHVWVRGRPMLQRAGYRWVADSWAQRNGGYYRQPGYWIRDARYRPVQHAIGDHDHGDKHHGKGRGHDKHDKHDKYEKHEKKHKKDKD